MKDKYDFDKEFEKEFGLGADDGFDNSSKTNSKSESPKEEFDFDIENEKNTFSKKSKKKNKGISGRRIYSMVATLTAVALLGSTIHFYKKSKENKEVIQYVKIGDEINGSLSVGLNDEDGLRNTLKSSIEKGIPMINILRSLYPEEIVVTSSNQFDFIPVIEGVKKNDLINANIKMDDKGEITYEKKGKVVSHKGIDVSKFQEDIDWEKVAADGVEYAIIRVGYRGYGTGAIVEDEKAKANIEGATKAGIEVGVYFFSQAITEKEAVEEAKFVIDIIKNYDIKYPVFFDTEEILNEAGRTEGLSADELTDITIAFCDTIEEASYIPGIYANLRWYAGSLNLARLDNYYKWYAYYDSNLYFPYKINMWQYSETGTVNGITGTVDMNISFEE